MKQSTGILLILLTALFSATASSETEIFLQFDEIQGRSYHASVYERKSCKSCHKESDVSEFPADFVCFKCHDGEELIQSTARPEDEKWQNPHNNLHYGSEVPCMECHAEHQQSKLLCAGCHSFEYPGYQ